MERAIRPDRVAVYIRWSTEEQSDGTTLAEQREGCEFYIKSQGWVVNPDLIFIDDGYSGASLDRPGMRELRRLVRLGEIDCVVVLKIDRLSRNIVDATQLVLAEWQEKCHLRCVRQPIDTTSETGRMFFAILATFADFERAQITERTYQGRIRRVKEGRAATLVQFGYRPGPERGVRLPDPVRAPVVAELFRRVREERAGVRELLAWLESEAIPAPNGGRWNTVTLRRILRNPIYAGRIVYGATASVKRPGRKTPYKARRPEPTVVTDAVTVPALVSPELFDAVQAILVERTAFHSKHRRALDGVHLLTGVARCRCGANINIHWTNGTRFYWCSNRIRYGVHGCPAGSGTMQANLVDALIVADLQATFHDPALRSEAIRRVVAGAAPGQGQEPAGGRLAAELSRLEKRLEELRLKAGVGEVSLEEWRSLRAALEGRRAELAGRLAAAEAARRRAPGAGAGSDEARRLLQELEALGRWHGLQAAEQKELVRRLAHSIELYKARGYGQPYEVKVIWRFQPGPHLAGDCGIEQNV